METDSDREKHHLTNSTGNYNYFEWALEINTLPEK